MTFFSKVFSFGTIKSFQNLYKSIDKSEAIQEYSWRKHKKKWAALENFGVAKSSPNSDVFQLVQVQTLAT